MNTVRSRDMEKKLAVVRINLMEHNPSQVQNFMYCKRFDVIYIGQLPERPRYLLGRNYRSMRVVNFMPKKFFEFAIPLDLKEVLKDVDVINSEEPSSLTSYHCARFSQKWRKKLIVNTWETIPQSLSPTLPLYPNARYVIRKAAVVIAPTKRQMRYLRSLSTPSSKVVLIYPGIDLNQFCPSNNRNHENVRILFVGRLVPWKGILHLLEAFSLLLRRRSNVELWIAGKGPMESHVRLYAKKRPVRYLGFVEYDKLQRIYQQCDIFCLPSYDLRVVGIKYWEEQFGKTLVEAMACGLPIVATNCGAIPEVVGTQNYVVSQKSVRDLYSALEKLIENENLRKYISKQNRRRAEELFDVRRQGAKIDNLERFLSHTSL